MSDHAHPNAVPLNRDLRSRRAKFQMSDRWDQTVARGRGSRAFTGRPAAGPGRTITSSSRRSPRRWIGSFHRGPRQCTPGQLVPDGRVDRHGPDPMDDVIRAHGRLEGTRAPSEHLPPASGADRSRRLAIAEQLIRMDPIPDDDVRLQDESIPCRRDQRRPSIEEPAPGDRRHHLDQFAPDRARGPRHERAADRRPDAVGRARRRPIRGWWEPVTQAATDLGPRLVDQEAVAGDEQGMGIGGQEVALRVAAGPEATRRPGRTGRRIRMTRPQPCLA